MKDFDGLIVADALADPASVFASPAALMANEQLSTHDKLRILEQWRANEQMARREHLGSTEDGRRDGTLRAVTDAITELTL